MIDVRKAEPRDVLPLRERYRREMRCQIVHDSIHGRAGWTREYTVHVDGRRVGYGSVAVGGPWKTLPSVYEFYVPVEERSSVFDLFGAFLAESEAMRIETQTNDVLLTAMLHTFARGVEAESILFDDGFTTRLAPVDAVVRAATPEDAGVLAASGLDPAAPWVVVHDGVVAGAGGALHHYNPPYADIYMDVAEPYRGRQLGAFLTQELKRVCYERGHVPVARCRVANVASRRTLQKAGFVPCGHVVFGLVTP